MTNPTCPYCIQKAQLLDSKYIYGESYGMIWICKPCDAYVGTHKDTNKPWGSLANAKLRYFRRLAHKYFDSLWERKIAQDKCSKKEARLAGYKWLALQLKIDRKYCHIGMFDVNWCQKVIDICSKYYLNSE